MANGSTLSEHTDPASRRYSYSKAAEFDRLDWLARSLDSAYRIPGTGIRLGWDSILGLIPGVGDAAALVPSAYIVYRAHRLGVPRGTLARMGLNVGIDWVVGSIPLIGDIFDVGFKANRRNVDLLRDALDLPQGQIDQGAM